MQETLPIHAFRLAVTRAVLFDPTKSPGPVLELCSKLKQLNGLPGVAFDIVVLDRWCDMAEYSEICAMIRQHLPLDETVILGVEKPLDYLRPHDIDLYLTEQPQIAAEGRRQGLPVALMTCWDTTSPVPRNTLQLIFCLGLDAASDSKHPALLFYRWLQKAQAELREYGLAPGPIASEEIDELVDEIHLLEVSTGMPATRDLHALTADLCIGWLGDSGIANLATMPCARCDGLEEYVLYENLEKNKSALEELWHRIGGWDASIEKIYTGSYEVIIAWQGTQKIVQTLQELLPGRQLNTFFTRIIADGKPKTRGVKVYSLEEARPMLEAFLHARFFLEMAVKCTSRPFAELHRTIEWTNLLCLYNLDWSQQFLQTSQEMV